jgi:Asp-tRNA(Asn)/Glu-tRNA(Gln) amidotransferase A subunit family amidase
MRLTCTAGLSGLPQMSIPACTIDGCPVGLSFIGWAGGDEALLERFRAKWKPVRVKKPRQNKKLEPRL